MTQIPKQSPAEVHAQREAAKQAPAQRTGVENRHGSSLGLSNTRQCSGPDDQLMRAQHGSRNGDSGSMNRSLQNGPAPLQTTPFKSNLQHDLQGIGTWSDKDSDQSHQYIGSSRLDI